LWILAASPIGGIMGHARRSIPAAAILIPAHGFIPAQGRSSPDPQARDNYRVILEDDALEFEIGSIGIQHGGGATEYWAWGRSPVHGRPALHPVLDRVGAERPQALATGEAGTAYLCHPFLIHAAQKHRGSVPRFMAQPPLHPAEPFRLHREDGAYSPVEIAIRLALGK
jgi:hypothetical protein